MDPSGGCCTGSLSFNDNASAGSASFTNTGVDFFDNASADHEVFIRASVDFHNNSTAGNGVHIAARVSAAAGPNEVIVSNTVRNLVAGSGLNFVDRGRQTLKGIPDQWRLFVAEEPAPPAFPPL